MTPPKARNAKSPSRTASKAIPPRPVVQSAAPSTDERVTYALEWLERKGTAHNRDGMARYGIVAKKVFGVSVADIQRLGKELGRDHALAAALWRTGWYEARMLAAFVEEVAKVTPAQMDAWAKQFDNWAICDTHVMHLFDRTPHAWAKAAAWSRRTEEFVKRAGFALYASLALHDKAAADARFLPAFTAIERESGDDRNFVRKAVNWALRGIGRRNAALRKRALTLSATLAASGEASARWIGKDALREFARLDAKAKGK
jgi:3-methyladenine DNA glycosylase AlkD